MKIELPPQLVQACTRLNAMPKNAVSPAQDLAALNAAAYIGEQLAAIVKQHQAPCWICKSPVDIDPKSIEGYKPDECDIYWKTLPDGSGMFIRFLCLSCGHDRVPGFEPNPMPPKDLL